MTNIKKQHNVLEELINSDVVNDVKYVEYLINRGEDVANRMPVAMRFDETTSLARALPNGSTQPATTNEIGLSFKLLIDGKARKRRDASKPNLLMFVGDPKMPNGDYMALEVRIFL